MKKKSLHAVTSPCFNKVEEVAEQVAQLNYAERFLFTAVNMPVCFGRSSKQRLKGSERDPNMEVAPQSYNAIMPSVSYQQKLQIHSRVACTEQRIRGRAIKRQNNVNLLVTTKLIISYQGKYA